MLEFISAVSEIARWVVVPLVSLVSRYRHRRRQRGAIRLVVVLIPADGHRA